MKPVYIDKSLSLLYIRQDGLLFVQLTESRRSRAKSIQVGTVCRFEQCHSVITGTVYETTSTGIILGSWEVKHVGGANETVATQRS